MSEVKLPPKLQTELDIDEKVIWFGAPVSYWTHLQYVILPFVMGIMACLILRDIFDSGNGTVMVNGQIRQYKDAINSILPIIVITICLSLGVFSPITTLLNARKTIYAVTNKRLLIVSGSIRNRVQSWGLERLSGLDRRSSYTGVGDIYFIVEEATAPKAFLGLIKAMPFAGTSFVSFSFLGISRAVDVEKIVRDASRDFSVQSAQ